MSMEGRSAAIQRTSPGVGKRLRGPSVQGKKDRKMSRAQHQRSWESTQSARIIQPTTLQHQLGSGCWFAICSPGTLLDADPPLLTPLL